MGVITGTIQAWMGGGEYNYFVVLDVKQNSTVLFHGKYLRRQPRISRMNVFLEKRTVYDEEFTEDYQYLFSYLQAIYQPLKTELKRKADAIEAAKNASAQAMKRKFFDG